MYDRPNTVVIECQEFSILPPVEELAPFIVENVLKEPENKNLFQQIASVFSDENARKYLIKMRTDESTEKLAELLAAGVTWPGYPNVEKGGQGTLMGRRAGRDEHWVLHAEPYHVHHHEWNWLVDI